MGRRGIRQQAGVDAAFCSRLQYYPRFGLPGFACGKIPGLLIRGMDLDRQSVARIKELEQQGKPGKPPGQFSQQLRG